MGRPRVGIPNECLAPHALRRFAREAPDRLATVDAAGSSITYRDLDVAGRTWAAAFRRIGVDREHHVATLLPNGSRAHVAWIGLAWLVAREVPLNNALQTWTVLQRQKMPGRLLVFPEENHWILKGEDSRFFYAEVHAWLARYLSSPREADSARQ